MFTGEFEVDVNTYQHDSGKAFKIVFITNKLNVVNNYYMLTKAREYRLE